MQPFHRHSRGIPLRWRVPSAVAGIAVVLLACAGTGQASRPAATVAVVRPGIDVLLTDSLAMLRGKRIGFVTNMAAVDREGVGAIARLRAAKVNLVALFGPEHGLTVTAAPGEHVASGVDSAANIPIYSLYGATKIPTPAMLQGIDLLLVDLPDVGARYYTYLATTIDVMKAAAPLGIPVVVLDRPVPIGGTLIEGNILDSAFRSAVGILAMPMRQGLTLAEGARLARLEMGISGDLRVVPAGGWTRAQTILTTGLPFLPPSPNLRDPEALFHYPGSCLFEGTPLSVGRGSDAPFKQIGAAWLDTAAVLRIVRGAGLAGVRFEGVRFQPKAPGDGKSADTLVAGIRLVMTDPATYRPVRTALHLLTAIRSVHPERFTFNASFDRLAGGPALRQALLRGESAEAILAGWERGLDAFRVRVKPLLLYPG